MEHVRYRTLGACLRAPRFALAYRRHADWITRARHAIESLSRVWGGAGAVLLPIDADETLSSDVLAVLRIYDPDVVAGHVPTVGDLTSEDADLRTAVAERNRQGDESEDQTLGRLANEPVDDDVWEDVEAQVGNWCSPFKGLDPDGASFGSIEVNGIVRTAESGAPLTLMPRDADEIIVSFDLTGVDPIIALMIETRFGNLHTTDRVRLMARQATPNEADLRHLVTLAITRDTHGHAEWRPLIQYPSLAPTVMTADELLAATPLARTARWLVPVHNAGQELPIVCVIGDTAADHALGMICDRLFHHAAWVPQSLLIQRGRLRDAARAAIYRLRHVPGSPGRPVLVTSTSLSFLELGEIVADIDGMYGMASTDPRAHTFAPRMQVIEPSALCSEAGRFFLADPECFSMKRTVPVREDLDGVSLLAPLDLPWPQAAGHLPDDLRWYVDVAMSGRRPPARTALSGRTIQQVLLNSIPDTVVRSSHFGITFCSANLGFVPAGAPREGRLARPLLRFPSAEGIFADLAEAQGAYVERSDAGRRAANTVELWGSFDAMAADLAGPTRSLLNGFSPTGHVRNGAYNNGYAIRDDGYVTFDQAQTTLGLDQTDQHGARYTLDRLLTLGVLRRGFILVCQRCRWRAFYTVDTVGSSFHCAACGRVNPLVRETWSKHDTEPTWYYSLDQLVRELFRQHGDLPLLAAASLGKKSRDFLWTPELVVNDRRDPVELDICVIVDGRIIVGEAKSNGDLSSGSRSATKAAGRLVRAAQILTADEIILATSTHAWAPSAIHAVRTALDAQDPRTPIPKLTVLENVGK